MSFCLICHFGSRHCVLTGKIAYISCFHLKFKFKDFWSFKKLNYKAVSELLEQHMESKLINEFCKFMKWIHLDYNLFSEGFNINCFQQLTKRIPFEKTYLRSILQSTRIQTVTVTLLAETKHSVPDFIKILSNKYLFCGN